MIFNQNLILCPSLENSTTGIAILHNHLILIRFRQRILHVVPFNNLYFSKNGPESETYLFDFETLKWYPGVDLQYPRFGHACGLCKIENRFVAFVVGGNAQKANSEVVQNSVEMLDLESGRKWEAGKLTYTRNQTLRACIWNSRCGGIFIQNKNQQSYKSRNVCHLAQLVLPKPPSSMISPQNGPG